MSMLTHMYDVEVHCRIGGVMYDISNISINISANSIPTIIVAIGGEKEKDIPTSRNFDIDTLLKILNKIAAQQYKPSADVMIKIKGREVKGQGKGMSSNITLQNWVVAGVGITDVAAEGRLSVQAMFMHPASELHFSGIVSYNSIKSVQEYMKSDNSIEEVMGVHNLIGAFHKALELWIKEQEDGIKASGDKSPDTSQHISNMKSLIGRFNTLIEYSNPTMFPAGLDATQVVKVILSGLRNNMSFGSIWNYLITNILPTSGIIIKPTYDKDKLETMPQDVWVPSINRIMKPHWISRLQVQPLDPSPIAGVISTTGRIHDGSFDNFAGHTLTAEGGNYINDHTKLINKDGKGMIEPLALPWWSYALVDSHGRYTNKSGFVGDTSNQTEEAGNEVEEYNKYMEKLESIAPTLANAHLYTRIGQYTRQAFITPLMITTKGGTMYGCERFGIEGVGLSFFVTGVEHVIDVIGRAAYSRWEGAYVQTNTSANKEYTQGSHPFYKD